LIKNILFIVGLLFICSFEIYGQGGYFLLRGRIINKSNQFISDVKFEVFENAKSIDSYKTTQQEIFNIRFELNKNFVLEISKSGYATKRILVDTKVPDELRNEYYNLFSIVILYSAVDADMQTKSGLPSTKYYYKPSDKKFAADELGTKVISKVVNSDDEKLVQLQAELANYKALFNQQKIMLTEADEIISNANLIKSQANSYADSLVRLANSKALNILKSAQIDTGKVITALDKSTKEISTEDFKNFEIDEKAFLSRKNTQKLHQRIERLSKKQKISEQDSLNLKRDRLDLRKEMFELAQYQLEIDRLNARTKEDSMRIDQRESQLFLMKQDMQLAEQELENANNKLLLKDLEIKNKNIMLLFFLAGSIFLLVLLAYIYNNYRDKKRINRILEYQNQELEKLSIVASETNNAIIITDEIGNFTWINKGYTRLFGYDQSEVTGDNSKCIIGPSNGDEINALIGKARISGEPVNYEFEALTKQANKIWVQTTLTPIKNKQGEVSKLIAIDSDISKIKEAEFEILKQSKQLKIQNDQIMNSINYAKRIQEAMLPSQELIKSYFPDSFIYFKPKDIVSGDFYWFSVQEDKLFVATVDCTGHGVPGAFMSLIGNSLLNHIVNEKKVYTPSQILTELNNGVNQALSQSKSLNDEREDGMDLTLCRFDKTKNEVQIACANHTAIIITDGMFHEFQGDEISIGESYSKVENLAFTNHIFPFQEDSVLYLFSDGYQDQIGGPKNKKFMAGNFVNFLMEYQSEAMDLQFDKLNEKFQQWKGENKQTDDVLVMGIRLEVK
jgi:PAS domain S-box-containing protein